VIAKCGQIKVHHWAHTVSECDPWWEPETEWHRSWKNAFAPDQVEVSLGEHRADVRNAKGMVLEFQNSVISPEEIEARELYYGKMLWIVNAEKFAKNFFLMKLMEERKALFSFKWKHMQSCWRYATRPVFFDFGSVTVADLLGAEKTKWRELYLAGTDPKHVRFDKIVRYRGAPTEEDAGYYKADSQFEKLSQEVLQSTILAMYSLHEGGKGAAFARSREAFMQFLGASADGS
jgi:hypothetical protein